MQYLRRCARRCVCAVTHQTLNLLIAPFFKTKGRQSKDTCQPSPFIAAFGEQKNAGESW